MKALLQVKEWWELAKITDQKINTIPKSQLKNYLKSRIVTNLGCTSTKKI